VLAAASLRIHSGVGFVPVVGPALRHSKIRSGGHGGVAMTANCLIGLRLS
jgi:hypothetical protein